MEKFENFADDELELFCEQQTKIAVVGVGGGGNNAVDHMYDTVKGITYISINTDAQHLRKKKADRKILIGKKTTAGKGAGSDAAIGKKAAEEQREEIREAIKGFDLIFITAGLGGGTGTGAAAVVAEIAREEGALTVGNVTMPFDVEGKKRMQQAIAAHSELLKKVHSLITIPNNKLPGHLQSLGKKEKLNMIDAFRHVDAVLKDSVQGVSGLVIEEGYINIDFSDVKKVMSVQGPALMGVGMDSSEDRARIAAEKAMSNPLLEYDIKGAKGIIVNITGGKDIQFEEWQTVTSVITKEVDPEAEIKIGMVCNEEDTSGMLKVTIIATGFDENVGLQRAAKEKEMATSILERGSDRVAAEARTSSSRKPLDIQSILKQATEAIDMGEKK